MTMVAGRMLPNKHVVIALTYIFGVGRATAKKICDVTKIDENINLLHVAVGVSFARAIVRSIGKLHFGDKPIHALVGPKLFKVT